MTEEEQSRHQIPREVANDYIKKAYARVEKDGEDAQFFDIIGELTSKYGFDVESAVDAVEQLKLGVLHSLENKNEN